VFADSIDVLSLDCLSRRLSEVRRGEEHLKKDLPPDSSFNAILRLRDILAYTAIPYPWIRRQFPEMYRFEFVGAARPEPKGKDKPATKHEIHERQRELSRFFYGWDKGTLVKARVGDEWKIVGKYQDATSLGGAPGPQAHAGKMIAMRIDPNTVRLTFK
jgi:hypothetical protein